jgi:prolyl oligopeptidase
MPRSRAHRLLAALLFGVVVTAPATAANHTEAAADPHQWLEEVLGDRALDWVRAQNAVTQKRLEALPDFKAIQERTLAIVNSRERIPHVVQRGAWLYNFWQDDKAVRGVWRRTTLAEYRKAEPNWEIVVDLDRLATEEKENWVWKGFTCLYPTHDRCLINLSRGGADATVIREFDVIGKTFVKDGFALPEAKGSASFIDRDTLYVQTDFGPGSMTASGYPRIVKTWKRGTALREAQVAFEGQTSDISVTASVIQQKGFPDLHWVRRAVTFFTSENFLRDPATGRLSRLDIPADANASVVRDWLTIQLRSDWKTGERILPQGALVATPLKAFLAGERKFSVLFEPSERRSLAGYVATRTHVLVNELDNVRNRLHEWQLSEGRWQRREVMRPVRGTISVWALDADDSDRYWLTQSDFLTPSTLYLAEAGGDRREKLKALPAFFDSAPYVTEQLETTSRDGTRIPYFVLRARDARLDGTHPTLLYGYGGFRVSQLPAYSAVVGSAWLARGGVYVVANIRGGGEFGPRWHQAALKANRQKAFDDFIAVGEDLIRRKITAPRHLAIYGGSNGGLLVGAVMTQRPELFRAVVCAVPLLDMRRYHTLLAGASWVAEYGNPDDPREWDFIAKYSPYHNLRPDVAYPRTLFITSTRDDRVHPGHARKMMAAMLALKQPVLYYENIEGGHGAAANNAQIAYRTALMYSFLLSELRGDGPG